MSSRTTLPLEDDLRIVDELPASVPTAGRRAHSFLRNSASNVLRIGITAVVSILLPTFLTHRLSVETYGAWVLILQLSAYVAYLNLGVQTAVSKYIAEYEVQGDMAGCGRSASVGLRIMLIASGLGVLLSGALAFFAARLFHEIPPLLLHEVRVSIVLVGVSLSVGLSSSVFSAIFLGLRQYDVPMAISVVSRVLYGAVVCIIVALHGSLVTMAIATAVVNLLTAALEVEAWRRLASHVPLSLRTIDHGMLRTMFEYCAILTIWSAAMLFISGLDVTIVGHFAFREVGFYSIANAPTNMVLLLVGALLGPLLPATSALSVTSTTEHMGQLLVRTTRYSTFALLATGLPLLVGGYPALRLWVGHAYAVHSIVFLQVLLLANIIRNLTAPFSTMVVAISRQRAGTASAIVEGIVNLTCSIVLARHIGAIGVALGTLIGSVAGVAMHIGVTMHYTRGSINVSRGAFMLGGLLRPCAMIVPSLLLLPRWWTQGEPRLGPVLWTAWLLSTAALAWLVSLNAEDRAVIERLATHRLRRRQPAA